MASFAALGFAACGDGWKTNCGEGTKVDPAQQNSCIPDGTVTCGQGTTLNTSTGVCESDGSCPDGTVLVNGECFANPTADAEESAEPNNGGAGEIPVPDVGADGYVIHGCITPQDDDATADQDPWTLTVTGPTLLDVTADGVGGLSAGFVMQPTNDPKLAALAANDWTRFGVNLSGDTASRQVFLPTAGTYVLVLSDSRQLFLQEAVAGSATSCYFATIKQLAIPTPTPLTGTGVSGKVGTEVQFYSVPALADGDLVFANLDMPSGAANASLVAQLGGDYLTSADESTDFFGGPVPAAFRRGGFKAAQSMVLAVDATYNYALAPVDFTLGLTKIAAAGALPTATGTVTLTQGDGTLDTYDDLGNFWFDVNAGDLVHFDLAFDDDANFLVLNSDLATVYTGNVSGIGDLADPNAQISGQKGWYRFPVAGRYYLSVYDPDLATGDAVHITSTRTNATATNLAFGTPAANQALSALNANFFNFGFTNQNWVEWNASSPNFADAIEITTYPTTAAGLLDVDAIGVADDFDPDGTTPTGRITAGTSPAGFIKVSDLGTPGAGETFTVGVVNRPHTELGTLTSAAAITKTGEDLGGAGNFKLYFVKGTPGDLVTVTVDPTAAGFNPTVARLDASEVGTVINDGGANANETFTVTVGTSAWIAFRVAGNGNSTGTYDLTLSAVSPVPYSVAPGTLAFTDICNGGANEVTLNATGGLPGSDEGLSDAVTLPFAFQQFGDDVTDFTISSNGFLGFGPLSDSYYLNEAIPVAGEPDGFFAPYWDDLENVVACVKSEPTKVTVQWVGNTYDDKQAVAFQTVIHSDGKVDYIYGADQAADGEFATVGAENLNGTFGNQIVFNTPNVIKPSTSRTLTPMP
ncbi:MAG: hypothetical protein K8W52_32530 [Deltaproteobacteria bacterium]|nr:hypothetical protein [Deltaproteobacteria bacterium]